jgi:hypothetical protein
VTKVPRRPRRLSPLIGTFDIVTGIEEQYTP